MSCSAESLQALLPPSVILSTLVAFTIGSKLALFSASFVEEIVNPLISLLLPFDLNGLFIVYRPGDKAPYESAADAKLDPDCVSAQYGRILNSLLQLGVTGLLLYMLIKLICRSPIATALKKTDA